MTNRRLRASRSTARERDEPHIRTLGRWALKDYYCTHRLVFHPHTVYYFLNLQSTTKRIIRCFDDGMTAIKVGRGFDDNNSSKNICWELLSLSPLFLFFIFTPYLSNDRLPLLRLSMTATNAIGGSQLNPLISRGNKHGEKSNISPLKAKAKQPTLLASIDRCLRGGERPISINRKNRATFACLCLALLSFGCCRPSVGYQTLTPKR